MFNSSYFNSWIPNRKLNITNVAFPRFSKGRDFYTALVSSSNENGDITGLFMDALPIHVGCGTAHFKTGETIDFHIINTMPTNHPIHIHLANFQVVNRFEFNTTAYLEEFQRVNGPIPVRGYNSAPREVSPYPFKIGADIPPKEHEKMFADLIEAPPGLVTVARFRIANHNGNNFPFKVSGMRYVWHCHILEHEDNEMMRYFCIDWYYLLLFLLTRFILLSLSIVNIKSIQLKAKTTRSEKKHSHFFELTLSCYPYSEMPYLNGKLRWIVGSGTKSKSCL